MVFRRTNSFALLTFKIKFFTTSKKADHIFEVLDILPLFGGVGSFDKSESFGGEEGVWVRGGGVEHTVGLFK